MQLTLVLQGDKQTVRGWTSTTTELEILASLTQPTNIVI
jgi:hypothetical protein